MTARQGKADGIVHEPDRIQVDRVEVATEVLLVALGAPLASHGGVKTLSGAGVILFGALEAQIVRGTAFPQPVARRTVPQPVQVGVGGGQLAG
jgi:hypothetical protein